MTILNDLRIAVRMLAKNPGFMIVTTATLALAIGANTVAFCFANILIVRPLPIADPDHLGFVYNVSPSGSDRRSAASYPDYVALRDQAATFESLAAWRRHTFTLTGRGDATRIFAQSVTGNLQQMWGLQTRLGRTLRPEDDRPGAPPVVVLSHHYWTQQLGAPQDILGQSLTLDGTPRTIVGVLAPDIEIGNLSELDVWTPLQLEADREPRDKRAYRLVGRLQRGATIQQAHTEIQGLAKRLEDEHPSTNRGWSARVATTKEAMVGGDTWLVMMLLLAIVGVVLVIACANITNILLARAVSRRRELAVRTALGASRFSILRQLLVESLVLGLVGGAAGVIVAEVGVVAIRAAAYEPFFQLVAIDRNVIVFAILLSLVAPVLFTMLPVLHSLRGDVNETLKEGGARGSAGVRTGRSRNVLVVVQVALALSLLVLATLVVRTIIAVTQADLGFTPRGVLTLHLSLPEWKYTDDHAVIAARRRVTDALAAIGGVESAATASFLPVIERPPTASFNIPGREPGPNDQQPWATTATVAADYFHTLRIPLVSGRGFTSADRDGAARVAVVSAETARRYWGDPQRALGGRIAMVNARAADATPIEIVGVVADLANPDVQLSPDPHIYLSADQTAERSFHVLLRAADPTTLTTNVRDGLRAIDPELAIYKMRTYAEAFDDELSSTKILTSLYAAFAGIALLLAATGLYGVMAYSVSQRTQELAIRMALGAAPDRVWRMVVGEGLKLTSIGLAFGLVGAFALARVAARLLYGVTPTDPATYLGVLAALAAAAVVAAAAPAGRAIRVDPVKSLRGE